MPRRSKSRIPSAPVCEPLEPRLLLAGDPPVITSITADNRGMIEMVVDQSLDPTTVSSNSVRVFTAGRDGLLGTNDDSLVSSNISYDIVGKKIRVLSAVPGGTRYRVQVFGDLITGNNGEKLDAEFNGASKKSGNGVAGGTLQFFTRSFALPVVRFTTFAGTIDVQMFADRTPLTVQNFFTYMNSGVYDTSFFHRTVDNFVVQGGGFTANNSFSAIPQNAPVRNEPGISNIRGRISMAKLGNNPNSATNQFFFNLGNNSGNLDNQNGGFTAFGEITSSAGLSIMDALAAFDTVNSSSTNGAFNEIPVRDADAFRDRGFLLTTDLITMTRVAELMDLTAEPFKQLPTEGQVMLTSPGGGTVVHVYSLNGVQLGGTSDFLNISFSGDKINSIKISGSIPSLIGIQIISSHQVGSITDSRSNPDNNLAFIVSNTKIGSISLKGGIAGYDINDTLLAGETLLSDDIDFDGLRNDPSAIVMLNSSLGSLSIGQNLNGSVFAEQGVQNVTVRGDTTNADFALGPVNDFAASRFSFGRVLNSSIDTQTTISSLSASEWISNGQRGRGIAGPAIGSLNITGAGGASGDFQGDLLLTGSSAARVLNSVNIRGAAFISQWSLNGSVGSVNIAGGTSELVLNATGDLTSFSTASASSTALSIGGRINSVRASEWLGGRIDAGALVNFSTSGGKNASGDVDVAMNIGGSVAVGTRSFRVAGALRNSTLSFASPVNGFTVGSDVNNTTIAGTEFNSLRFGRVNNLTLNPTGKIKSVTAWEWLGGAVTGTEIKSFSILGNRKEGLAGDLSANVRLTQPGLFRVTGDVRDTQLNITFGSIFLIQGNLTSTDLFFNQLFFFTPGVSRATIAGTVIDSQIIANDVVGDLVIGGMERSTLNIGGAPGNNFFTQGNAFAQTGYARSITIGKTGSKDINFSASSIIGNRIDSLRIVGVDTFNGNVSFGVSLRSFGTVDMISPDGVRRFSTSSDPFFLNDFEVRPNFVAPDRA